MGTSALIEAVIAGREPKDQGLERIAAVTREAAAKLSADGSLWVISRNMCVNGSFVPLPLEVADRVKTDTDLHLKNVIIRYSENSACAKPLVAAYEVMLLFVKSLHGYFFNKTVALEPHVFRDIEWGRRKVGSNGYHSDRLTTRYPEGGRDPGNVFYKVRRDIAGAIEDVSPYPRDELLMKLVMMTTGEGWLVVSNIPDELIEAGIVSTGRAVEEVHILDGQRPSF